MFIVLLNIMYDKEGARKAQIFPYTNFQRKAFLKNYRNYIVLFNLVALEKLLLLSSIKMVGLGWIL
jgi:hypothetical protein